MKRTIEAVTAFYANDDEGIKLGLTVGLLMAGLAMFGFAMGSNN